MKKIVLDSDVLIDYTNGHAAWIDILIRETSTELILPSIVFSEFLTSKIFDDEEEIKKIE